ncbi:MAG: hypothetical protein ACI9M3_001783 [Bacteroidia bacterium]|jgi:hypothetical protein
MKDLIQKTIFIRALFLTVMLALFSVSNVVLAQDCAAKLEKSALQYENGQFAEVINALQGCTKSEDKNEQWKAYRLLALAYLGANEQNSAKAAAVEMLKLNPTYKGSSLHDPSEFIKLLSTITVIPKFSLGLALSLGTNSTFPRIDAVHMVTKQTKTYEGLNSFQFGVSTAYQINEQFGIDMTVMASSKKYKLDYSFGNWDLNMDEDLTYVNLPVEFKYTPKINFRLKPFVKVGGYAGYLLFSSSNFSANHKPSEENYSIVDLSSIDRRNRLDLGVVGSLGATYQVGAGQLFVQASYFNSMKNAVKGDERYSNKQLLYSYYYIDDDFTLSNLAIGVGYSLFINYKVLND